MRCGCVTFRLGFARKKRLANFSGQPLNAKPQPPNPSRHKTKMSGIGIKIVVVGDSKSGKTSLIFSYGSFTRESGDRGGDVEALNSTLIHLLKKDSMPSTTGLDNISALVKIEDQTISLGIWDTSGDTEKDLRSLIYPQTDCFLLLVDVANPTSIQRLKTNWIHELRDASPSSTSSYSPTRRIGGREPLILVIGSDKRILHEPKNVSLHIFNKILDLLQKILLSPSSSSPRCELLQTLLENTNQLTEMTKTHISLSSRSSPAPAPAPPSSSSSPSILEQPLQTLRLSFETLLKKGLPAVQQSFSSSPSSTFTQDATNLIDIITSIVDTLCVFSLISSGRTHSCLLLFLLRYIYLSPPSQFLTLLLPFPLLIFFQTLTFSHK
jgi:GTPase SAR1 family protein